MNESESTKLLNRELLKFKLLTICGPRSSTHSQGEDISLLELKTICHMSIQNNPLANCHSFLNSKVLNRILLFWPLIEKFLFLPFNVCLRAKKWKSYSDT